MHTHNKRQEKGKMISHKWHRNDSNTTEGLFFKINGLLRNTPDRLLTLPESIQKGKKGKRNTEYKKYPQVE